MIRLAENAESEAVFLLRDAAIRAAYPHYYPRGAVDWFLSPDNRGYIAADVRQGKVCVLTDNDRIVGTVTVNGDELTRLFVLPAEQGKGYGRQLAEFAIAIIFAEHDGVKVDAALSATKFYDKLGFHVVSAASLPTPSGDYVCWNIMEKRKQ